MSLLSQHTDNTLPMTVYDVIAQGRYPWRDNDNNLINEAINALALENFTSRNINTLSGGEQQRVHLARILTQNTDILLLDEPTNHLDFHHKRLYLSVLKQQLNLGKSIIIATHDIEFAKALTQKTILLDQQEQGLTDVLLNTNAFDLELAE